MYDSAQLTKIFQSKYDAEKWRDISLNLFSANEWRQEPEKLEKTADEYTGYYLGAIKPQGEEKDEEIGFFYYHLKNSSVAHKRVGLRNLVKTFVNPRGGLFDAAIAVFDDGRNWRVSFVSDIKGEKTAPKRYTFLFGDETQQYRTATDRFLKLQSEGVSLKTLKDAFSVESLTKEFYKELFAWYQWALEPETNVSYPNGKKEEHLIRLITRLMFVWFIKQKKLIPNDIFDVAKLQEILKDFDPASATEGNYYNAILQNLFFATLNRAIKERTFTADKNYHGINGHYGIKTLFRDNKENSWFNVSHEQIKALFARVPFLNGGLFECLDKEKDGKPDNNDGFSREKSKQKRAFLPNCLFFDGEKGLISILKRYNFTVEENTPNDADVALDPELLGKVFENLLGAYNPETKETARKQSGSFYTPRKIVNYMVDESLKEALKTKLPNLHSQIDDLFNNSDDQHDDNVDRFPDRDEISEAIKALKILDPACGSGAFPMGVLSKMIDMLKKLDPNINLYETKLNLIENCIYGVDIQTIAAQISKLRFFISLIVEQMPTNNKDANYGILPLPNLELKFIAADTLISLDKDLERESLFDDELHDLKNQLWDIRIHKNLRASSWQEKKKLRDNDKELCEKIKKYLIEHQTKPNHELIAKNKNRIKQLETKITELKEVWVDDYERQMSLIGNETPQNLLQKDLNKPERDRLIASVKECKKQIQIEETKTNLRGLEAKIKKMTDWDPYDQNAKSPFFDPEWMFGVKDGFDIVIGNPPYISTKGIHQEEKLHLEKEYGFADDTYSHFFFKGIKILSDCGNLTYITPKTFWTTQTKKNLRDLLLAKQVLYIFDTANPFESAMVDTCIISASNKKPEGNKIKFLDGSKNLSSPLQYSVQQNIYLNTQNSVIFKPTNENLKIQSLYGKKVKELYEQWWEKISTSKNIEKNKDQLEVYRKSLKPGDVALLGCLTEGGQGLATANNGKYIAVRKSTKWAKNIIESRPKKLADVIKLYKIQIAEMSKYNNTAEFLDSLSERQIAALFDSLKEKYGRDIFGQGYIYRLINDSEIVDVDTLTDDEKKNGIAEIKRHYVPYDKGDKDGNRWYLETPFAIAWTQKNVGFLKANSGKKGEGMPVVRNSQFYFREGFCWSDISDTRIRCRFKGAGIHDVKSMSLFSVSEDIPYFYFICMIVSSFIGKYIKDFVNNTVSFQINDARQLPIIIPAKEKLLEFEILFNFAIEIKLKQFSNQITIGEAEKQLSKIQRNLDQMVYALYGI
ncbi:MAG: Eco57I restriction-modification methylase domain-containing protein [Helicobacteraceae bacterium]|jgi:hypothetical protein|nr:Eco57I restriction-modification methylase domain-containing protein [Helicobacteraceae bacterium]